MPRGDATGTVLPAGCHGDGTVGSSDATGTVLLARELLRSYGIGQSMDGKARWVDNVIIERWFRSLKTENIYISEYRSRRELRLGVKEYIEAYNNERPHSSIEDMRPVQAYNAKFGLLTKTEQTKERSKTKTYEDILQRKTG